MGNNVVRIPTQHVTLYELEENLLAFANTVDMVTPEQRAEFEAEFGRWLAAGAAKYDAVARFIHHLESQIDLAKAEEKRLKARALRFDVALAELKRYVLGCMALAEKRSLDGSTHTLLAVKNNDSVKILDEAQIPQRFKRHVPAVAERWEPDKAAIAKAIKEGFDIPGADLIKGDDRLEVK